MDVQEIRRNNLIALVEKYGGQAKLAKKVPPTAPGHISQMYNATRDMGNSIARRFEDQLDMTHGWMDMPHDPESVKIARSISEDDGGAVASGFPASIDVDLFDRVFEMVSISDAWDGLDEYSKSLLVLQLYADKHTSQKRITRQRVMELVDKLTKSDSLG
jgi:hypothetical protein